MLNVGEILGFVGTILVLVSFVPKDIVKIRAINILGCIAWIVSAVFSKSLSVMVLNSVLMIIHVIHLVKIYKEKN